jgi:hypothetical protein
VTLVIAFSVIVACASQAAILSLLLALLVKVNRLMAKEQDLQDALDQIKAGVAAVAAKLAAQAQMIADLQAQVAAGTPVTQDQLDALKAEADTIVTALAPLTT